MKIIVKDGQGERIPTEMERDYGINQSRLLPAFLPDGTVCSDGEFEGEVVDTPIGKCYFVRNVTQSPADKYIAALEGLKKVDMTGWAITYVNIHNNAIDLAIKTIREL